MTQKPPAQADRLAPLRAATPARIFLAKAGASVTTAAALDFALAHARARDAVEGRMDSEALAKQLKALGLEPVCVESAAPDRSAYLARPDLGRRLAEASRRSLAPLHAESDVVFVVADGLSAGAVMSQAIPMLEAALPLFRAAGASVGPVVLAQQARVAIGDEIGELLGAKLVAVLIGERPGLSSPKSLGVYLTFAPRVGRCDAERNCLSNIHAQGMSSGEAAQRLFALTLEALRRKLTGVALKDEWTQRTGALPQPADEQGGRHAAGRDLET